MGPLRWILAGAAVAGGLAVVGLLVLAHDSPTRGVVLSKPLDIRTSFAPPRVQFGDRVVARVDVVADRNALDTSRLVVTQDLAPLSRLGPVEVTRTTRGRALVASYTVPAVCIAEECLARSGAKRLRLPRARVEAPRRDGGGTATASTRWPVLEVGGRVAPAEAAESPPPLRADTTPPAVSYRLSPGRFAPALDVVAVLLGLTAVALAAWQALVLVRRHRTVDRRDEVERALALVCEAEGRPAEDRRRALGLLSRVLRRRDGGLATEAGDLAWSEPKPTPEQLASLRERVAGKAVDA